ncbi:MAG: Holliday junction branch migration protein RuvA [Mitsuokella jalaludinii]|uniref:Holliday junction branch migration protein RuvA n=1 Tax=uncultured Mitsuokella sp. TaxID=453120 RepID=UPI002589EC12|nr:Holliday junction branch migration protein RuvA [uncultured Mitsuokella sp.]MCI7064691.1 Holliday junction branch migration protein RuvA [Mitsuokella jalaludinii]
MIGYLHGRVIALYTDHCLLDVHGVGYRVFVANSTRTKLRQREEASLFIYTSVREDAIVLYGFATEEEYDLFLQLIGVSGIGPKVALGILSAITVEGLCRAIQNKQASVLTKLPGIGKKSAERLILELKDKVAFRGSAEEELLTIENGEEVGDDAASEAMAALQSLGYTPSEIAPVIRKTAKYKTTEAIIKASLKELSHM